MTAIPSGANAEDCPTCRKQGDVTVYPWICPGHPEPVAAERPVLFAPRPPDPTHPLWCATCGHEDLQHVHPATEVAAEPTPPVDLRTRIAAAFEAEDSRNWGYDHDFAADDAETLAFADVAIAVVGAERDEARAEVERLTAAAAGDPLYPTEDRFHVEVQQHHGAWWTNVPYRSNLADAEADASVEARSGRPARVVHDRRTYTVVASRAPEGPADATTPRETPDA